MCYCRPEVRTPYCDKCPYEMMKEINAAREVIDKAEDLLASVKPFLDVDCKPFGTCKDCLEDGRGTHTEQSEYNAERLEKALKAYEEVTNANL